MSMENHFPDKHVQMNFSSIFPRKFIGNLFYRCFNKLGVGPYLLDVSSFDGEMKINR